MVTSSYLQLFNVYNRDLGHFLSLLMDLEDEIRVRRTVSQALFIYRSWRLFRFTYLVSIGGFLKRVILRLPIEFAEKINQAAIDLEWSFGEVYSAFLEAVMSMFTAERSKLRLATFEPSGNLISIYNLPSKREGFHSSIASRVVMTKVQLVFSERAEIRLELFKLEFSVSELELHLLALKTGCGLLDELRGGAQIYFVQRNGKRVKSVRLFDEEKLRGASAERNYLQQMFG
jgi:hypothetical protein